MRLLSVSRLFQQLEKRSLYSASALGMDNFNSSRIRIKNQHGGLIPNYKEKIRKHNEESVSTYMVFTEDLKNIIYLASVDELPLIKNMAEKFNTQDKGLRFGQYVFGPEIMRVYHLFNKPVEALEAFTSPGLAGMFHQLTSYQILMDLLYNNEMYSDVESVFHNLQSLQMHGGKYPKDITLLLFASLYKQDTDESYEKMLEHFKEARTSGAPMLRRTICFAAALALRRNHPDVCINLLEGIKGHSYITVKNIKISALCDLNKLESVIHTMFETITEEDQPSGRGCHICHDIIEKLVSAANSSGNQDIKMKVDRIVQNLKHGNLLTTETLDDILSKKVEGKLGPKSPSTNFRYDTRKRSLKNEL